MPLLALALAAAALSPGVQPLAPAGQAAVVGDAVDVADVAGGHVTVTRYPLDGSSATGLLDYSVPAGKLASILFDASAQRSALGVQLVNGNGTLADTAGFLGGTGPLTPITPTEGRFAGAVVSGDTVFVTAETDEATGQSHAIAVAPDGTQRRINFPNDEAVPDFAGDFLGYSQNSDPSEPAPDLRLYDWRTGKTVRRVSVENDILNLDVRADGAMVVDSDGRGIKTILPGQAPKVIYAGGGTPTWAGDRVVVLRHRKGGYRDMVMIEPDGSHRRFGIASPTLRGVSADADNVSFSANGCAMTMPTDGGAVTSLQPGPCAHSEAMITNETRRYRATPDVELPVRCLYADSACQGELRFPGAAPAEYTVPAGTRRYVALALKPAVRRRWTNDKDGYVELHPHLSVQGGHTTVSDVTLVTRRHPGNPHHD